MRGTWWRVFGIVIVYVLVLLGLLIVGAILVDILSFSSQTVGSIAFAAVNALLLPIMPIGATLVYFDLRVRKEGYTLDDLAAEMGR